MYSLDCKLFCRGNSTQLTELIRLCYSVSGMDPNHEITRNGKPTGEFAIDLIQF
jgi:hypothetical protein